MKQIQLTKDRFTIVDDDDFEWLSKWKWYFHRTGYACRSAYKTPGKTTILMHREIIGAVTGLVADHINCNKLDNRKNNLRIATHSQNAANSKRTLLKGTCWRKRDSMWEAYITVSGKTCYLGRYKIQSEAAAAYDAAAKTCYGDFARLNFP